MTSWLRIVVRSGISCGTSAVLQEQDGVEMVNGVSLPRWKDVRPLRVIEKDGNIVVDFSESECEINV